MLKNYFKIAWRNLLKRKFYSLVTIFGLSVGMTFTFLMMSYVSGELNVNQDLRHADHQVIMRSKWKNADMGVDLATLGPLGETLKQDYPNLVANYYRYDGITVAFSKGDKHFREDVQTGDSTLLAMYGFPLLHGDARSALSAPNSIAITENKAIKYFGKTDVLGETLTLHNFIGGKQEFQITAVLKDLPNNSITHLLPNQAEIFIPFSSMEGRKGAENNWEFPYMITFLELQKGVSIKDLDKPISQILRTHASEAMRANLQVYLTPLKLYYREANNGLVRKMILTLSGITAFILFMAIVNFVNISIGNSSSRLKEIGVRKVLGSLKRQLIGQFLAESVLLASLAMIFSIGFYELSRPFFADLLNKPIHSVLALFPYSLAIPLLSAILIGALAGIYPAFVLSSIPSVDSMKGKLKSIRENVFFRRLLISSQFSIALFVFAGAAIVSGQVNYFVNKDLGYEKESLITVGVPRDWTPAGLAKMQGIRDELSRLKEIKEVSLSYEIPNGNYGGYNGVYKSGQDSANAVHTLLLGTDENYAETYGIKMLAGEYFQPKNGSFQPDRLVVNEAAIKALGFSSAQEAVGQQVRIHSFAKPVTITGVCKNFHFESMHQTIKPLAFVHIGDTNSYRYLSFRIKPSDLGKSITEIETKWRTLMPDAPFEFVFMDDTLQKLYTSEIQLKKASQMATGLAIVIVLLGILGMVSLNVARRMREVGIRKVLGASGFSVVMLFLKEFLLVLIFAAVVAFPTAMILMNKWLEAYAYRIEIGWGTFVRISVLFTLMITVLVFIQTYKTALMNPVKSLRGE
ncbi:ABC transporter permease [Dyadobacter sp. CY323]|uniref:ABC transporter permease n=1 Tax=Dyadobacter sp. CY323 TaxID=2907302 RepID=UPI001F3A1CA2|nr:ABC transporter permease [Dyadobacter sp. CY323]MCE6992373.1 ABC transporter permease [Dyadobacter sp. CY323]